MLVATDGGVMEFVIAALAVLNAYQLLRIERMARLIAEYTGVIENFLLRRA